MAEKPGFEVVEDEPNAPSVAQFPKRSKIEPAIIAGITMALKALSQRAIIAVADLFTLITVLSAFWLWWSIPDPNTQQIVALGIYAVFILAANVIVRRGR